MFHGRMLAAALATAFAWAQDAPAPGVEIDRFPQLPGLVAGDLKAAATAPAAWSAPQWGEVGLGAAALVGVSMALDRPVDKAAQYLAEHLPTAIDKATPGGVVPPNAP